MTASADTGNPLLRDVTTFRLGGPCRRLITCTTEEDAKAAWAQVRRENEPCLWIGGGSNILVSDHGVDAVVLRYVTDQTDFTIRDGGLECCAAIGLDHACAWLVQHGWDGLTFCSGIPGTLGGGIVGNAGAWGQQIGDVLDWVDLLSPDGSVERVGRDDLGFHYRHSNLKERDALVLRARIRIEKGDADALKVTRQEILERRAGKHPNLDRDPCIGSFFRNIEPSSAAGRRQAAGWFLEQAGAGTMRRGGARVFEKHANIIVAGLSCSAEDVYRLSEEMRRAVYEKFDLSLVREIRLLGAFQGNQPPEGEFFH